MNRAEYGQSGPRSRLGEQCRLSDVLSRSSRFRVLRRWETRGARRRKRRRRRVPRWDDEAAVAATVPPGGPAARTAEEEPPHRVPDNDACTCTTYAVCRHAGTRRSHDFFSGAPLVPARDDHATPLRGPLFYPPPPPPLSRGSRS